MPDALSINSRKVRVALSTTINDPDITLGNVITQMGNNATANYVGTAGSITGALNVINIGVGYTGPLLIQELL